MHKLKASANAVVASQRFQDSKALKQDALLKTQSSTNASNAAPRYRTGNEYTYRAAVGGFLYVLDFIKLLP